jgi:hypothetical protein
MTLLLFLGCNLVVYAPLLALFALVVAKRAQLVVISIGASFFWLLSIFATSILWFSVVPLRWRFAFILPFSVLFQEGSRWLFYHIFTCVPRAAAFPREKPPLSMKSNSNSSSLLLLLSPYQAC